MQKQLHLLLYQVLALVEADSALIHHQGRQKPPRYADANFFEDCRLSLTTTTHPFQR
ncbi:hypothetical protein SAMN04490202_0817 [Pseudomonas reinekei]|uniref:Uncharacterized protein n=1 Tax=Pseudomonas reinekei TaxID=395598 RepID=A0A1H0JDA0_PSERE|nr:hypothetical protein SAMN04490202_0817 [Pseudomonas reinekei]